jgi:hypothetical protein
MPHDRFAVFQVLTPAATVEPMKKMAERCHAGTRGHKSSADIELDAHNLIRHASSELG